MLIDDRMCSQSPRSSHSATPQAYATHPDSFVLHEGEGPQQHCMDALPCACFRPVRNMAIPSPCKQNPCTRSTHHAPTPTHPCAQTPGAWCTHHGHLGALPEYARGAASPALPQSHMHAWPSAPTHPMHGAFIVVLLEHARGCCLPARMQRGTGGAERAALPRELE